MRITDLLFAVFVAAVVIAVDEVLVAHLRITWLP